MDLHFRLWYFEVRPFIQKLELSPFLKNSVLYVIGTLLNYLPLNSFNFDGREVFYSNSFTFPLVSNLLFYTRCKNTMEMDCLLNIDLIYILRTLLFCSFLFPFSKLVFEVPPSICLLVVRDFYTSLSNQ